MAIINPQHLQFIEKCVEYQRDHIRASMEVYGYATRKEASTQSNRLLKNVEIKAEIDSRLQKIIEIGTQEAVKQVKKRIVKRVLTLMDKREILASIATGTYKVKIPYVTKDKKGRDVVKHMTRAPLPNEARLAIDLDAQLMGEKSNDKADPGKLPSDTPGETVINKLASADLASLINLMNASPLPNTSR